MGFPLRHRGSGIIHHISVQTYNRTIDLVNYSTINPMIGGVLARYQEMLGILIYAFCFNGNHFHLVVEAPNRNLDEFMQYILREISRRMRRIVPREQDRPFWSKRYSDQIIPTENDEQEAFLYTTTNAVKHGLIDEMNFYPGFSSFQIQTNEETKDFHFTHYSKKNKDGSHLTTRHTLTISRFVSLREVESAAFKKHLGEAIKMRELLLLKERNFKPALGRDFLLSQTPGQIPESVQVGRRPTIYTKSKAVLIEWRTRERERRQHFDVLSRRYREGDFSVVFPESAYPPSRIRKPKPHPAASAAARSTVTA